MVNNAAWGIIQLLDFCSLQVFAYDGVYLLAADILLFSPHLLAVATQARHEPTKISLTFLLNWETVHHYFIQTILFRKNETKNERPTQENMKLLLKFSLVTGQKTKFWLGKKFAFQSKHFKFAKKKEHLQLS